MEVFHKRTSFPIHNVVVRLRQGYGGTDFLASFAVVLRLPIHPADRGMACPDVKKAVRKSDGFWKSGGAKETRTLDPHTASVML